MKSNIEWQQWGERDPLFAVATWEGKEKGGQDAWQDSEFYELGRADWADFQRNWEKYSLNAGHCVEIGCGAGRITKQLSQYFRQVTGLDVSQHQLDYARKNIPASNATLTVTDGTKIPLVDSSCDAAFSVHVFQHFESHDDALAVFKELHRALVVGGTLMVHLPLYNLPSSKISFLFKHGISLLKWGSDVRAAINRRHLLKGEWKPVMRSLRFDRDRLLHQLREIGFADIEFHSFPVKSNGSYHEFVFATKAA